MNMELNFPKCKIVFYCLANILWAVLSLHLLSGNMLL